jgi:hypothetical protein
MSTWSIIPYCQSTKTAETISVLEGIKTIIPMEPNPVVVECDNVTVVNDLKASDHKSLSSWQKLETYLLFFNPEGEPCK